MMYSLHEGLWAKSDGSVDPRISSLLYVLPSLLNSAESPADWFLDRQDSFKGTNVYVLRLELVTAAGPAEKELWVDGATLLPAKLFSSDKSGMFRSDIVFSDWGADIQIVLPEAALNIPPTATPAPASPLTSSSLPELSESLLEALIAMDLTRVQQFFPPDRQPADWCEVYLSDTYQCDHLGLSSEVRDHLTDCEGFDYEYVQRDSVEYGVSVALVTIIFDEACAFDYANMSSDKFSIDRVGFIFENSTGRWYLDEYVIFVF